MSDKRRPDSMRQRARAVLDLIKLAGESTAAAPEPMIDAGRTASRRRGDKDLRRAARRTVAKSGTGRRQASRTAAHTRRYRSKQRALAR
ncbi:MAG: hypothetical protein HYZ75_12950 [Elusimicrobia bacterium]|nr:hypothetical protein [Elusimicrobiota bacterium]